MSATRSALDEMFAGDDDELSARELASDLVELSHVAQTVEVLRARKVRSLADRGSHRDLGYSSPTALLVDQAKVSLGHAKRLISYGNARDRAPHAYAAWSDGRLTTDQAVHLFRAAEAAPDEYPDAEERLVEIVEPLDAVDTGKAIEYWRQAMEGPGDADAGIQQVRRGLSASPTLDGMVKVDRWLTTAAGEAFMASLDANMAPPRDGDTRTPRQRRHDALENLCRDWLDNGTTPTVGGEKPQIVLHTDMPALQGIAGGLHETENGDIIEVDALRMIACDCSITRIVFGADSEILDVGRKTRIWSPAQRRAITARDRHCKDPDAELNPDTATSTMKTTGQTAGQRRWTKASSTVGPATCKSTSRKACNDDTVHELRGGPCPPPRPRIRN